MSDVLQTAIINWLRATADDAMGMEPGDRHMANETRKELERLEAALAISKGKHENCIKDNERLQARVAELEDEIEDAFFAGYGDGVSNQIDEYTAWSEYKALEETDDGE